MQLMVNRVCISIPAANFSLVDDELASYASYY